MTGKITHLNDKTMKYKAMAQADLQHRYLLLPGNFKTRYPHEVILDNMGSGRMDELYLTDTGVLINLEEESDYVGPKTFIKIDKYNRFIRCKYNKEVYHVIICHKDPKKKFECYKVGPSNYLKIYYIYFNQDELWEKYENIINKVEHKEKLTDAEAMDMAFITKFIADENKQFVIENITAVFDDAIIENAKLKMDVAIIINAMIMKTFTSETKQEELRERIGMKEYENEMERIVYEEYGDELRKKDNEIVKLHDRNNELNDRNDKLNDINNELNNENKKYKDNIEELKKFDDFNSAEAKKIIHALMVI